jgi:hypothetical protein
VLWQSRTLGRMGTRAHTVPRFYLDFFADPETAPSQRAALWVCDLASGKIKRRAAKNLSIHRGVYDGPGGLTPGRGTIEQHLSRIESDAANAIRDWVALPQGSRSDPPVEITRFVAWLAARTLPMREMYERWFGAVLPSVVSELTALPEARDTRFTMEDSSGNSVEATLAQVVALRSGGWRIRLSDDQFQQILHLQAWAFQTKHFAKMSWGLMDAPAGHSFITSARPVVWTTDALGGLAPPGDLGEESAVVVAPLTRTVALVGHNTSGSRFRALPVREVNRYIARLAGSWIAGPTRDAVACAFRDVETTGPSA